mmetsp:Transcript_8824/g.12886  ORF Transcript_8824/g.12886 Transcript_8824/m.12886 type:complete len:86 (+) Transcript_8824:178-435(+)
MGGRDISWRQSDFECYDKSSKLSARSKPALRPSHKPGKPRVGRPREPTAGNGSGGNPLVTLASAALVSGDSENDLSDENDSSGSE